MPDPRDEARRRQERIRRRTTRLDGQFAFAPQGGGVPGIKAEYSRGQAEKRASELLAKLPALPAIVLEASKPAGPESEEFEKAIDVDPDLASVILAAGGAGFFLRGAAEKPSNLAQLIDRAGTAAFRSMTFLATFKKIFSKALPWYGHGPDGLWWHLVGTAVAAWKIAEALGFHKVARELVFLGSLLHDIGKPTIQGLLGGDAPASSRASMQGRLTVLEAERAIVSLTHPELVPLMLDIWGVEHSIFPIAEHHHAPQRAGTHAIQASIIHLADMLANAAELGLERPYAYSTPPVERVAGGLKLPPRTCEAIQGGLGWAVADIATEVQSVGD